MEQAWRRLVFYFRDPRWEFFDLYGPWDEHGRAEPLTPERLADRVVKIVFKKAARGTGAAGKFILGIRRKP